TDLAATLEGANGRGEAQRSAATNVVPDAVVPDAVVPDAVVPDAGAAFAVLRRALQRRLRGPLLGELSLVPDQAALEAAADEVAALQGLDALLQELATLLAGEALPAASALVARIEVEAAETDYTPRDRRRR